MFEEKCTSRFFYGMVLASSDSNFEGFTFDDAQNINENNSNLSLDESDIDIYESLLDNEDFDYESDEHGIENIMATWLKTTITTSSDFTEKISPQ